MSLKLAPSAAVLDQAEVDFGEAMGDATQGCQYASQIVSQTAEFVRARLYHEDSGHDWWHVYRVWQTAKTLCNHYPEADWLVVELAALLHDVADWKQGRDASQRNYALLREYLHNDARISESTVTRVLEVIGGVSFKGGFSGATIKSLEGKIVQDADRLDAMGAIGIARTFIYGGRSGQKIYDPNQKPRSYVDEHDYIQRHDNNTALNHFYEKLLRIRDSMQTEAGRARAEARHHFMLNYLEEFYGEWDGLR